MEEITNLKQEDVDKLINNFPFKPYRNGIVITVNTEETVGDLVLTDGQFAETQYVLAVGDYFGRDSIVKPGKKVLLDIEKMMVFEQASENSSERVGRIKLKPLDIGDRMYALITDGFILGVDER